jgi:hypothetical protein
VVLEKPSVLPEGASVRVAVMRRRANGRMRPNGWDELLKLAGSVKGLPRDLARNHDHYLHGRPKR